MSMLRHFVHHSFSTKNIIAYGLTLLCLLMSGCDWLSSNQEGKNGNAEKRDENVITFVTINSPNTYYLNSDREFSGLEYDLAVAFSAFLEDKKQIEFIVVDSIQEVVEALVNNRADIAAADLTLTASRKQVIDFSIPYQSVQQQVIYNNQITSKPAKNIRDLVGKEIVVPASTSFVERLKAYQKQQPELSWTVREASHSENIIEEVAEGAIEYTIADNHLVSVLQNFHPQLDVAFSLGKPEKIAWGFAKGRKPELLLEANAFFTKIASDGTLRNLIDRYHGNSNRLNQLDVDTFLKRTRTILPQYKKLFKDAQEITGIDWRMIAALSYQESHWNTFNTSPTNVRGLMMLTEATSDQMGVMNRLDPKESIPAGAKYLNLMINTLPERIPEPDRTYMALAAYNIGYAHVEDARVLAQRLGLNPDSWVDVKKALLKLNNPEHYASAKYGYCRCAQPVIYVESIRSYYNILSRFEPAHEPFENDPYKIASN
jgi:membrane-bound lytic murein transglycosylase F